MAEVGERLKQVLKSKGLKAARLAEMLSVPSGTVSKWLSGDRVPSGKMMLAIQKALELPSNWTDQSEEVRDEPAEFDYPQLTRTQNVAIKRFAWNGVPPEKLRQVVEGLEKQKFVDGFDAHPEYWRDRINDLLNERASKLPDRRDDVDLTRKSPELEGVRKRPSRL